MGQSDKRVQRVEIALIGPKVGFKGPKCQQYPRWNAKFLLNLLEGQSVFRSVSRSVGEAIL